MESISDETMVRLLYMEVVRHDSYLSWQRDPRLVSPEKIALTENQMKEAAAGLQERYDLGYLCKTFESWDIAVKEMNSQPSPVPTFPTYDDVSQVSNNTIKTVHEYEHDGLTWRADWRINLRTKKVNGLYQTRRTLVIHLPNDGYLHVNEEALKSRTRTVKNTGRLNPRHLKNCKDGWAELEHEVWGKLAAFETYMVEWFGEPRARNATRTLLYHADANKVDICMQSSLNAIEFSFQPSFPIALDDGFWTW
jgi:hypothetical protein